jgi:hypothetical protein
LQEHALDMSSTLSLRTVPSAIVASSSSASPSRRRTSLKFNNNDKSVVVVPSPTIRKRNANAKPNLQKLCATQELLGFDLNPAALGFICVMVVWGIPQTLGMSKLDGNEKIAREKMLEWGIDTTTKEGNADYIYKNNYGAVQARFKKECEKRGEKPEDYL